MAAGGGRRLKRPSLADGSLKRLNDALHELHRRAGRPSTRDMSREINDHDRLPLITSHTRVYDVFSQERLPDCDLLLSVVQVLADRQQQHDQNLSPAMERDRFYQLWLVADETVQLEGIAAAALPPVFPIYMVVEESAAVSDAII